MEEGLPTRSGKPNFADRAEESVYRNNSGYIGLHLYGWVSSAPGSLFGCRLNLTDDCLVVAVLDSVLSRLDIKQTWKPGVGCPRRAQHLIAHLSPAPFPYHTTCTLCNPHPVLGSDIETVDDLCEGRQCLKDATTRQKRTSPGPAIPTTATEELTEHYSS